jgi:c-di-GMP-binding flagellar brake protein YcgR
VCARNVPAELHFSPATGPILIGRVRLLELTDKHILADKPAYVDATASIPADRPITVHVTLNGVRYQFESVVDTATMLVRLNDHQHLLGIALRRPKRITRSQRRSHLRVSLVGIGPIPVELVRAHTDIPGACPVDARVIPGLILDLSAGGLGILIDNRHLSSARPNELFFLSFVLPGLEEEFCLLASVRHKRCVRASGSLRIGFALRRWDGSNFGRDQHLITRFVTEHERRLLRRRK